MYYIYVECLHYALGGSCVCDYNYPPLHEPIYKLVSRYVFSFLVLLVSLIIWHLSLRLSFCIHKKMIWDLFHRGMMQRWMRRQNSSIDHWGTIACTWGTPHPIFKGTPVNQRGTVSVKKGLGQTYRCGQWANPGHNTSWWTSTASKPGRSE